MQRNPILVAGRGAVSCFGAGHQTLLDAVFEGRIGIRPFERLAGTDCNTPVAAEVPADILAAAEDGSQLPLHMAGLAAREALAEWGGTLSASTLLCVGSTKADLGGIISRGGTGLGNAHTLAQRLATELSHPGPVTALSCACASGLAALAHAGRLIRSGAIDTALVVGTDGLNPFIARGFGALLALSPEPARPFDRRRMGLSLGEGAGAIVLTRPGLQGSGQGIGFELAGWGQSNDANHITGPCRDGSGLALALQRALSHADTAADSIDFVHMHGTGTPYNDAMESRAMERIFTTQPAAAGTKGQIGHTLGAAGILESLVTLAALDRRQTPPNVGLAALDDESVLAMHPEPRPLPRADSALKLAAGFGGINAALLFRRTR